MVNSVASMRSMALGRDAATRSQAVARVSMNTLAEFWSFQAAPVQAKNAGSIRYGVTNIAV
jgi:hypothetical protein